jgi:hypothetical protein
MSHSRRHVSPGRSEQLSEALRLIAEDFGSLTEVGEELGLSVGHVSKLLSGNVGFGKRSEKAILDYLMDRDLASLVEEEDEAEDHPEPRTEDPVPGSVVDVLRAAEKHLHLASRTLKDAQQARRFHSLLVPGVTSLIDRIDKVRKSMEY